MRIRSHLMIALTELNRRQGWSQKAAAEKFGVTQPRISDLMRGKVDIFSLDTLIDMATMAGLAPKIAIRKAA